MAVTAAFLNAFQFGAEPSKVERGFTKCVCVWVDIGGQGVEGCTMCAGDIGRCKRL